MYFNGEIFRRTHDGYRYLVLIERYYKNLSVHVMKKSDLIVRVLTRANPAKTEEELRQEVGPILLKLNLDDWSAPLPAPIRDAIIRNIRSEGRRRPFEYLIRDIDAIFKEW